MREDRECEAHVFFLALTSLHTCVSCAYHKVFCLAYELVFLGVELEIALAA